MSITTRRPYGLGCLLLFSLVMACCSSGPTREDQGGRSDIPDEGPEPGELEAQLRQYLIDVTALLSTERDDPHDTVVAVGRYLDRHSDEIRQTAREVRARVDEMNDGERAFYQERFSEYFVDTTRQWYVVLEQFRQAHPEEAPFIDGLMIRFD